ncbi:MAG: S-methyl-5-thioribose-1-phosphate isomerase [Elusimicrobia bacterium]|nr:S-methyl-5-thioribose-1-phosphate isomerase [Elusimicrobiota bacterium]
MKSSWTPILWKRSSLRILDQRELPHHKVFITARSFHQVANAIQQMALRGAPLIGASAAYGYVLGLQEFLNKKKSSLKTPLKAWTELHFHLERVAKILKTSRPTAVSLFYAVNRMENQKNHFIAGHPASLSQALFKMLEQEAETIFEEDVKSCQKMAEDGSKLIPKEAMVMTYCNTGALATCGIGTALGVIRQSYAEGKIRQVYVCETRPYLQGSRLTLWELMQDKIPATLITDNMAAYLMKTEKIDAILVGADRIAANGDVANKIGTYALAIQARHHRIPFYVVAPTPTLDFQLPTGADIPIEQRSPQEVLRIGSSQITSGRASAWHPAFDVTPHELITALVTEKGIVEPPNEKTMGQLKGAG